MLSRLGRCGGRSAGAMEGTAIRMSLIDGLSYYKIRGADVYAARLKLCRTTPCDSLAQILEASWAECENGCVKSFSDYHRASIFSCQNIHRLPNHGY